jgi:hypothetical protein
MFRNAQSLCKLIETPKGSRDVVESTREVEAAARLSREPFLPWNHARSRDIRKPPPGSDAGVEMLANPEVLDDDVGNL